MMQINAIAIAFVFIALSSAQKCDFGDASCQAEDVSDTPVSMLQVTVNNLKAKDDIEEGMPHSTVNKLGSLSSLDARLSDGACEVNGIFTDGDGVTEMGFATNKSSLHLLLQGQPRLTVMFGEDSDPLSMSIGGVKAVTPEESETEDMKRAVASLAEELDGSRMKRFSDTLGRNGLHGDRGPCLLRLHTILLSVASSADSQESKEMASKEEAEDEELVEMPQELISEEEAAAKVSADSNTTASLSPFFRFGLYNRRRGWSGYGFGPTDVRGCQATMTADWQCRVNPGPTARGSRRRGLPSPYYVGGSSQLGGYKYRSMSGLVNIACTGGGGCSSAQMSAGTCASGRSAGGCTGMCGRDTDCWTAICGSSYRCGYNPNCCAHDKSCQRRRVGNHFKCYSAALVGASCGGPGR